MTQFILTIVGDTNDADYITATNTINDVDTMALCIKPFRATQNSNLSKHLLKC